MKRPAQLDSAADRLEPILDRMRRADWPLVVALSSLTTGAVLMVISGLYPELDTEADPEPPTVVLESCEDALMHAAKASTADQRLDKLRAAAEALAADLVEAQMSLDPDRIEEAFEPLRENAEERKRWENTRSEQRSLMNQRANDCRNGVR